MSDHEKVRSMLRAAQKELNAAKAKASAEDAVRDKAKAAVFAPIAEFWDAVRDIPYGGEGTCSTVRALEFHPWDETRSSHILNFMLPSGKQPIRAWVDNVAPNADSPIFGIITERMFGDGRRVTAVKEVLDFLTHELLELRLQIPEPPDFGIRPPKTGTVVLVKGRLGTVINLDGAADVDRRATVRWAGGGEGLVSLSEVQVLAYQLGDRVFAKDDTRPERRGEISGIRLDTDGSPLYYVSGGDIPGSEYSVDELSSDL